MCVYRQVELTQYNYNELLMICKTSRVICIFSQFDQLDTPDPPIPIKSNWHHTKPCNISKCFFITKIYFAVRAARYDI